MRFIKFKIKNFKGIDDLTLDLGKNPNSSVYSLVGLNESGKTTILEALNYFVYKTESLDALDLDRYKIEDIHDLIPINRRDNFTDSITISATLEFEDDDEREILEVLYENLPNYKEIESSGQIKYTQIYHFENSKHIKEKDQFVWKPGFKGRKKRAKSIKVLENNESSLANEEIKSRIPSILYFPNFLFEFPEKIYLEIEDDAKSEFYQRIIQDVLDSLNNDLNIQDHIIDRLNSNDATDKRSLDSVINKMNFRLTNTIFKSWNQIFGKEITDKKIILLHGKDNVGAYLEFNIQDDVDTYRISERSLGFRWFFVFLLLTQFRSLRKENHKAIFLLDEPASNLHPSAQQQLLKSFSKLNRVIYTTHSHYLINPNWLENTFVVKNEGVDYDNIDDFTSRKTNIVLKKYREFATLHPNQITYFQPILDVLDFAPSDLDMVPFTVFVEGKSDFYFYRYAFDILFDQDYEYRFIPGTSASNMKSILSLYIGWGKRFIILLDSDKEGKRKRDDYNNEYGKLVEDCIYTYEDINPDWSNVGLEKLLPKYDKMEILKSIYPQSKIFNKKNFGRSIQELLIKEKKIDTSDETRALISLIHKFIETKI